MKKVFKCSISYHDVVRTTANPSQTKLNRAKRWDNVKGIFDVVVENNLRDKHVLIIDDTLTTGATLESCGQALLTVPGLTLSIATAAYVH